MGFRDNFARVFTTLNQSSVRYMLVGGLAVSAHGHTRATADIDISLAPDLENVLRAIHALSGIGYRAIHPAAVTDFANPECRRSWIQKTGEASFRMETGSPLDMPLDLFAEETLAFDAAYARAASTEMSPGFVVSLVPLDALLELKRASGRARDLDDIAVLRSVQVFMSRRTGILRPGHPKDMSANSVEADRLRAETHLTPAQRILRALEITDLCYNLAAAAKRSKQVGVRLPLGNRIRRVRSTGIL